MELKELENFIEIVYISVGERYSADFKYIIGGCHCYPPTEWYGDIFLTLNKVLKDDIVGDKDIKTKIVDVVEQLSKLLS